MFGRYDAYLADGEGGLIPDLEFLKSNVDPKMKYIADAGLVNAIGYSWGAAICREGMVERYKLLAKYLIARYGAYPVVWTLAGELPGYFAATKQEMTDKWREIAIRDRKMGFLRKPAVCASGGGSALYRYLHGRKVV